MTQNRKKLRIPLAVCLRLSEKSTTPTQSLHNHQNHLMMTEELQDFDSMCHASISSIGTIESLNACSTSSCPTINSLDQDSITCDEKTATSSFPTANSLDALDDLFATSKDAAKAVTWAPKLNKRKHISRYQMSYEEAKETWIFEDEKSEMMEQHMAVVKRQEEGLPEDGEEYTYRGLDGLHDDRAEEVRKTINTCVQAVIQEQNRLRESNQYVDPLELAMVSTRCSAESTKAALCQAECDQSAARGVYRKTVYKKMYHSKFDSNSKRVVMAKKAPKQPTQCGSRPTTNHFQKYATAQTTRIVMRG